MKSSISSTPLVSAVNHMAARTFREKNTTKNYESFSSLNIKVYIDLDDRERARVRNK